MSSRATNEWLVASVSCYWIAYNWMANDKSIEKWETTERLTA